MATSSRPRRVSVIVADDHPLYREGIVRAIKDRPDLELVGEAADGREAIDAAAELRPDVMVLDESMPVLRGTEAIPRLREVAPEMRIVLYSAYALTDQRTRFDELADAVVAKGLDLRDLARLVANI